MPSQDLILFRLGDKWETTDQCTSTWELFVDITTSDILKIKDKNGYSNLERIYFAYGYDEREEHKVEFEKQFAKIDTGLDIEWPPRYQVGTLILVPKDSINRQIAARDGGARQIQKDPNYKDMNDANAFMGSEIERYITQEGYSKTVIGEHIQGFASVKKEMPNVLVMIWCRGLRDVGREGDLYGKIQKPGEIQDIDTAGLVGKWIDISKYIQSIETNIDDNGGNFTITLPPVQGYYDSETQGWEADKSSLHESDNTITGKSAMYERDPDGSPRRTEMYFKNAISSNDLIFIAFEGLQSETDDRLRSSGDGDNIISQANNLIPEGHGWDMIGLVDNVNQGTNPANNEISINVNGRDLSKLIIEDGSYIFPLLFDEHNFINKDSRLVKRNLETQSYDFYAEPRHRTIKAAVQFIINVASNIRIIPDNVAEAAGGSVEGLREKIITKKDGLIDAEIIKLNEGTEAIKRLSNTYGGPISSTDIGDISTFFALKAKVASIVASTPETESISIKYSDYHSIIQVPIGLPLLGQVPEIVVLHKGASLGAIVSQDGGISDCLIMIKAAYDAVVLDNRDKSPREVVETVGGGVWRWVALLFDKSIQDRKLADVSLGRPDGSLINLIWNYAQAPWVEFLQDTWNDRFYFTFRTPPWTKKLVQEHLRKGWIDNTVIEDVDMISENLDFDTEQYSMYQIDYGSGSWGTNENLVSVIPTIPFPELAEIWGNKRLKVSTNMLPLNDTEDGASADNLTYVRDRGIDDLMFVVSTNIYKPFTRKGTITINGDRRLKKGTWFLYKPTNEIFYIVNVSQNYKASPIDRTTTITVERGMVLDYVTGDATIKVDGKSVDLTYFDIVDIENIKNELKEQLSSDPNEEQDVLGGNNSTKEDIFKINRPVLDFFLQRRQFGRENVKL